MPAEETPLHPDTGTRLAFERTFLAHERTLLAWIRTGLGLISFGFAIAKFFEYLHEKLGEAAPLLGAKNVGILMIAMGLVALTLATLQQGLAMRALRMQCPGLQKPLSWVVAALLALIGLLALAGAMFRS